MKLKSIAIAAFAVCAVASASAATVVVNAAGGSATRPVITNVVVESVCGAAAGITVYHNGSNVTRITCPVAAAFPGFAAGDVLDFSYDNTTGSYLGVGPVSGAGVVTAAGQGALRINTASCTTTTTEVAGGKTVASKTGCTNEATQVRPGIGNADVELEMFANANIGTLPAPIATGISASSSQFGIIFGVIVSEALYKDLAVDQGINLTTCGTLYSEACAPSLSRGQIASIATANGGPLNTDWSSLFTATTPALRTSPVNFVRRVAGSGTQTSFNANFLGYLCSARGTAPAVIADSSATYIVNELGSTGTLLTAVNSTTAYKLGIASRENTQSGTNLNWGFVKVDGVYPSKANTQNGKYNWMAEQTLLVRANPSAAEQGMFDKLVALTTSPTVINGFSAAAKDGTVALPFVADAADPQYLAQRTRFRTFGNSCVVPTAAE
jgi:hypothetical protein